MYTNNNNEGFLKVRDHDAAKGLKVYFMFKLFNLSNI